jgi:hypothetical protein
MSAEEKMGDIGGPASGKGINGFVLNLVIPGLGNLLYGRTEIGVGQLVMALLGIPMFWFSWIFALAMIGGAWIWSAVTGFQLMSSSS